MCIERHFPDFESLVHCGQMQMENRTTGIDASRIDSPANQKRGLFESMHEERAQ